MCNLYRMTKGVDEIARLFDAIPQVGANHAEELYPGYPGLVVAEGRARTMTWGFPLALKGLSGRPLKPKAVTNAREDKLSTAFWRDSFARRRCLIPVSAWAEAEGEKGRMTRTWYAMPAGEPFAVAGLWRPTAEWGDAYAMVMVDASEQMVDVHDRMPVILATDDWSAWIGPDPDAAFALCRKWDLELQVERTRERWAGGGEVCEDQLML
jgi:putative SOS response-associated peptidase YedK